MTLATGIVLAELTQPALLLLGIPFAILGGLILLTAWEAL